MARSTWDASRSMHYAAKGRHRYLVNSLTIQGLAPYRSWRCDQFLALFLTFVKRASQEAVVMARSTSDRDRARLELEDVGGQIDRLVDVLSRGFSARAEERLRKLEAQHLQLEAKIRELELQSTARSVDLREIDWDDSSKLRDNLRSTVKRIDMDPEKKWFRAEMLDGAAYTVQVNGAEAVIEIEGDGYPTILDRLSVPAAPPRRRAPKAPAAPAPRGGRDPQEARRTGVRHE